jgi:dihydrofolate reductase
MKVILVMVMSVDGKTTKWGDPGIYKWTSKEDREHFFSLIDKHRVIVMGRKTFEAARAVMKLSADRLRVVLTHSPEEYKDFVVGGQLEFTNDSPVKLSEELKARNYSKVLLVGGEHINGLFLKAGLVSEVWVTVEPVIFGVGNGLASDYRLGVELRLKNVTMLNKRGSLLLKYEVI